ncbi:MAG: DUF1572 domain-containing protein [Chitinophagaceae bacterium]|nr:MAG: DUF1572 domain-containing protein [Chitinophagaceae bacterium]
MTAATISEIIQRDLDRLKKEIMSYRDEANIWRTDKGIANSAGNLCLHLVGNLNTYIGDVLGGTGYVRERDLEFSRKNVPRTELAGMIEVTIAVVAVSLKDFSAAQMDAEFPTQVFDRKTTTEYMLIHLASHLGYHLGQVNYHRRLLDLDGN